MIRAAKATSGVATRAEGALAQCGPGSSGFELWYSCQGPACSGLDGSLQNIVCHRDGGSTLICSNDVKCRPGASTYQSNFTFSQNEPDPWSPTMENKPDIWVPQDQHIIVGGCNKFSLTSDGTKRGTHLVDAENTCPDVRHLSAQGVTTGHVPTSTDRPRAGATQRPLIFAGVGSSQNVFRSSLLPALIFALIFMLPGAQASVNHHNYDILRRADGHQSRAASDDIQSFVAELRSELAEQANNQGVNGEAFASSLIASVVSSVCQGYIEGSTSDTFDPEVVNNCVASIYSIDQPPQPALQFMAIFSGSMLCNYLVSETYPNGQDYLPESCNQLQSLMDKWESSSLAVATPSSTATELSIGKVESSGTFVPVASSDAEDLDRSIATSHLQASTETGLGSTQLSKPSTALDISLSSSALMNGHLSTAPPTVNDPLLFAPPPEVSVSGRLSNSDQLAFKTAAVSQFQASGPPKLLGAHPESTEQAFDGVSFTPPVRSDATIERPPNSAELLTSVPLSHTPVIPSVVDSAKPSDLPRPTVENASTKPLSKSTVQNLIFDGASLTFNKLASTDSVLITLSTPSTLAAPNPPIQSTSTTQTASNELAGNESIDPFEDLSSPPPGTEKGEITTPFEPIQTFSAESIQNAPGGTDSPHTPVRSSESLSLAQISGLDPSVGVTWSTASSLPAASRLSSQSYEHPSSQEDTSSPSLVGKVPKISLDFSADPLASGTRIVAAASEQMQTLTSEMSQYTTDRAGLLRVSAQTDFPVSSITVPYASFDSLALTQNQNPVKVETARVITAPVQVTTTAEISLVPESKQNRLPVNDWSMTELSGTDSISLNGSSPIPSSIRAISQDTPTLLTTSLSTVPAEIQTTRDEPSNVPTFDVRPSSVIDDVSDVLVMGSSSTVSTTIALPSGLRSLGTLSIPEDAATSVKLITASSLEIGSAYTSPSAQSVSSSSAVRSASAQAMNDPDPSLSSYKLSGTSEANNTEITVTPPVVSSLLITSFITALKTSRLPGEIGHPGTVPWPASDSPTVILPPEEPSVISTKSAPSLNPASKMHSRSSDRSTATLSNASAMPISASRPSGARTWPIQDEFTAPATLAASTKASVVSDSVSFPSQSGVSRGRLTSSQVLMSQSPPADMSMPSRSLESGHLLPSSSKLKAPAIVSPGPLPSVTTGLTPSNGSIARLAFMSTHTEEIMPTTTPAAKVESISDSSHAILGAPPGSVLTALCAQYSSTPNFCPSSGCVSLMTHKSHCGACDHVCVHMCYQGMCVCPDFSTPDEKNKCPQKPAPVEPTGCPPSLPDLCDGICFNIESEHNHCGGCGRFCSGICVAGSCFAKSSPQVASTGRTTGRTTATSDLPVIPPAQPARTTTIQPVVAYIWRGLAGPQQA